jgi:hypothetical protein
MDKWINGVYHKYIATSTVWALATPVPWDEICKPKLVIVCALMYEYSLYHWKILPYIFAATQMGRICGFLPCIHLSIVRFIEFSQLTQIWKAF